MTVEDDWRITNQESHLSGAVFVRAPWLSRDISDHEHGSFCWAKFVASEVSGSLQEGYATPGYEHWVCAACFEDFKERFDWELV